MSRVRAWWLGVVVSPLLGALPAQAQVTVGLPGAPTPSVSIGHTDRGSLRGGVELPEGAVGVRRLTVLRTRQTAWGTRGLVDLLLRVGRALALQPDNALVPLRVGNLSLAGGGEMRWSHSHQAGREADLLPFLLDAQDQPVLPDAFVVLDDTGRGRWQGQPVHLDVPRTWMLLRLVLLDTHAHVQALHLAEPLAQLLLAHGRALGEDEWLLQRARSLLSEPAQAGRHDDHIHVRLHCTRADRLAGCQDAEERRPWVDDAPAETRLTVTADLEQLADPDADVRQAALAQLAWFQAGDPRVPEALVWLAMMDPVAGVRDAALRALQEAAEPAAVPLLWAAALAWTDAQVSDGPAAAALLDVAVDMAQPDHAPLLLSLLTPGCGPQVSLTPEECVGLQVRIAQRIRPWMLQAAASPLLVLVRSQDATVRRAALQSVRALANRPLIDADAAERWWQQEGALGRRHWLRAGMLARGVRVDAPLDEVVPQLLAMLDGPDDVAAQNAESMLQLLLADGPIDPAPTLARKHRAWLRHWQTHARGYTSWRTDVVDVPAEATSGSR